MLTFGTSTDAHSFLNASTYSCQSHQKSHLGMGGDDRHRQNKNFNNGFK